MSKNADDVIKDIVEEAIYKVEDQIEEVKNELEEVKDELEEVKDDVLEETKEDDVTIEEDRIEQWMQQTSLDLAMILELNKTIQENQLLTLQMLEKPNQLENDPVDQDLQETQMESLLDQIPDQDPPIPVKRTIVV